MTYENIIAVSVSVDRARCFFSVSLSLSLSLSIYTYICKYTRVCVHTSASKSPDLPCCCRKIFQVFRGLLMLCSIEPWRILFNQRSLRMKHQKTCQTVHFTHERNPEGRSIQYFKYPYPKTDAFNGFWDRKPHIMGTWILWERFMSR